MYQQHMFLINEFFTISVLLNKFSTTFIIQRNEHVELNNFSCSLSCTWMTIIDCLFYASDSLSRAVSWDYIAKLLVAWFYQFSRRYGISSLFSC